MRRKLSPSTPEVARSSQYWIRGFHRGEGPFTSTAALSSNSVAKGDCALVSPEQRTRATSMNPLAMGGDDAPRTAPRSAAEKHPQLYPDLRDEAGSARCSASTCAEDRSTFTYDSVATGEEPANALRGGKTAPRRDRGCEGRRSAGGDLGEYRRGRWPRCRGDPLAGPHPRHCPIQGDVRGARPGRQRPP